MMLTDRIGIMIVFVLGYYFDYRVTSIVVIAVTIIFVIVFLFFPESPTFLLKQNKTSVNKSEQISFLEYLRFFLFIGSGRIDAILSKFSKE